MNTFDRHCCRVQEEIVSIQNELNDILISGEYSPQHLKDHKSQLEDQLEVLAGQLKAAQASLVATPTANNNAAVIAEIQQKMKALVLLLLVKCLILIIVML